MYTCYDCELFANGCSGVILPEEKRTKMETYCPYEAFKIVSWREQMFKKDGTTLL